MAKSFLNLSSNLAHESYAQTQHIPMAVQNFAKYPQGNYWLNGHFWMTFWNLNLLRSTRKCWSKTLTSICVYVYGSDDTYDTYAYLIQRVLIGWSLIARTYPHWISQPYEVITTQPTVDVCRSLIVMLKINQEPIVRNVTMRKMFYPICLVFDIYFQIQII